MSDDRRIKAALPTLNFLLNHGAGLVLVSHLGRPSGDPEADRPFRLDKVAARLGELLGRPVTKVGDTVGPEAKASCQALAPGGVVVLENVRFNKGEKKGDPAFAREMAALADVYVNDAFGTCHRDEASMVAVPEQFAPENRALGFLVEKELQIIETLLAHPRPPLVAVMGGAKVSTKLGLIENLLPRVQKLLVGGAMSYTFLKADGHATGNSLVEPDLLDVARDLRKKAGDKLVLPVDFLVADKMDNSAEDEDYRRLGDPRRLGRVRHRPEDRGALLGDHPRRRDGRVERPCREVRDPDLLRRDAGDRPGDGLVPRHDRPWAAARRPRRSSNSGSPTKSPTSRPAAGRSSRRWKASSSTSLQVIPDR